MRRRERKESIYTLGLNEGIRARNMAKTRIVAQLGKRIFHLTSVVIPWDE
jgi:hypothetical protein